MNQIIKSKNRPEYNTDEHQKVWEEKQRKLRAYTKKALKFVYTKAKKENSDKITRLIDEWGFDVPGWKPYTNICPIFHKTEEDFELEKEIASKVEILLLNRERANHAPRDDSVSDSTLNVPHRSNEEKMRDNAESILNQFRGTEIATRMCEAFSCKNYRQVLELALLYDMDKRRAQSAEKAEQRKATPESCSWRETIFKPQIIWSELLDEIIQEEKTDEASTDASGYCSDALRCLEGDLNYNARSEAKEHLLQCLKSLEVYPQSTIPLPKVIENKCTCIRCTNSQMLNTTLKEIIASRPNLNESEIEEIDNLFIPEETVHAYHDPGLMDGIK